MAKAADHLAHARAQLERCQSIAPSSDLLRGEIRDSWQRCLDAGLNPVQQPKRVVVTSQKLGTLIEQNSHLVHLAKLELCKLQRQCAGNDCVLGFANHEAILLDYVSSNSSIRAAVKATPGSCWNEGLRGTNAIGTAAFTRSPVFVEFSEHFLRSYQMLTCAAVPVMDPDGELVGVLHKASNCGFRQQHTIPLLSMSALYIEAELFWERYRSEIVIQLHSHNEFVDTCNAGLIALNPEGGILCSNRQAKFFLEGLPVEAGRHFDEVFRVSFRSFVAGPQVADGLAELTDIRGSCFSVRVHHPGNIAQAIAFPRTKSRGVAQLASPGFVCEDPVASHAVALVKRAVEMRIPILIRGETGTGKEMLAQHAHRLSRRSGPFVAINCAAVPESLIEAELFGYRGGAFTGAQSGGAAGLILQADKGTLFLDEIGDMPINLQPALLRFLDSWTVRPIGSVKEQKVDVQLVTATNCDLEQAIADRRFRRDLLYRINGVDILLPPLRNRSDFDQIVRDLLSQVAPHLRIAEDTLRLLREQHWIGNMRELRNILVRSALTCDGPCLSMEAVGHLLPKRLQLQTGVHRGASTLLDLRREAVLDAYGKNSGNISKAARSLSVSRNTLYRELRQAGLIENGARG
jgi:sigma-54 dependent transcriptional regulator, acetoin dehydrogenase operon transcriptional activator AcoR